MKVDKRDYESRREKMRVDESSKELTRVDKSR